MEALVGDEGGVGGRTLCLSTTAGPAPSAVVVIVSGSFFGLVAARCGDDPGDSKGRRMPASLPKGKGVSTVTTISNSAIKPFSWPMHTLNDGAAQMPLLEESSSPFGEGRRHMHVAQYSMEENDVRTSTEGGGYLAASLLIASWTSRICTSPSAVKTATCPRKSCPGLDGGGGGPMSSSVLSVVSSGFRLFFRRRYKCNGVWAGVAVRATI
mmetsp:Transcript_451/g.978  ORF Transcript_451/g.978 Transcript_451/m.978 type:complete len:211 (-) Transcript_451:1118-1750(-)